MPQFNSPKIKRVVKRSIVTRWYLIFLLLVTMLTSVPVYAGTTCGSGDTAVQVSIDLGCKNAGNGIVDLVFAIIRFLTVGVGLVIVGSMVVAGIQYTSSRGDPQATARAIERIRNNLIALLLFIFAFAILNWVVPGTLLQ